VNTDFVPVALKAALVNYPANDEEGRLYREIGRSKVLPQGICVINSACKVLAWAEFFDDDKSVVAFLDHCLKRGAQFPDAKKPFPAERYMKFPSQRLPDIGDNGKAPVIVERHSEGKSCPATPRVPPGTIDARLFGRALDKDGKPVANTLRQENYVEDRFQVPVAMQASLAMALKDAGSDRFRLADDLARLLVSHAFLGELDVNPVDSHNGSKGALKQCDFWARRVEGAGDDLVRVRLEGKSQARGVQRGDEKGFADQRLWQHEVNLAWQGIIEMKKDRMSRLLLVARGSEKLKWGNVPLESELQNQRNVILEWAGRTPNLSCEVRFGIIGEPVAADQAGAADAPAPQVPDEVRKHMVEALGGGPFLVFRDKVQQELKLSDEQKEKLLEKFPEYAQETKKVFDKIADLKPEEREKEMRSHRQKSHDQLMAFLKDTLKAEQLKRLQQLELQQQGPFALGRPEIRKKLKIMDKQLDKFRGVIQDMQKKIEPLMKEAQSGGNPQEIRPKVMKIRKDHEAKIEAILSDAQQKQWKKMLGKPFDLGD
jgi:hypothetical protein